jgi:hypothetical protein
VLANITRLRRHVAIVTYAGGKKKSGENRTHGSRGSRQLVCLLGVAKREGLR